MSLLEVLQTYSSLWARISTSNSFDTRACKAFAKELQAPEQLNGQKCIEFLIANLDKAVEKSMPPLLPNQCDNSLEEESKEKLVGYITKCFSTDRGLILLENHMMFFLDARSEDQKEAWFKETMEEWRNNLHSSMIEGFENALRLWMLSKL